MPLFYIQLQLLLGQCTNYSSSIQVYVHVKIPYQGLHHLRTLASQFIDNIMNINHILILHLFQYNIQSNEGPSTTNTSTKCVKNNIYILPSITMNQEIFDMEISLIKTFDTAFLLLG